MKLRFWLILFFVLALLSFLTYRTWPKKEIQEKEESKIEEREKEEPKIEEPKKEEIKSQVNLPVPFTSQAPYGLWDDLHNNACEEAALLMVHFYLKGQGLNKEVAEKEIQKMVSFQIKNYGGHFDLDVKKTAQLARDFYLEKNVKVYYDIKIEDIKRELGRGNPVIVPTAGRILNNPYYRRPGPLYHMLVIRGYNEKEFITNDNGTRRGNGWKYPYERLYNSLHDWNNGNVLEGKKAMIIIER